MECFLVARVRKSFEDRIICVIPYLAEYRSQGISQIDIMSVDERNIAVCFTSVPAEATKGFRREPPAAWAGNIFTSLLVLLR